ncbi:MAG TPA: zinc ribbon domain-containing protein [Gemmataceae bacterium]|nr:zinc ribbon domain-containing protein [Gemmataceae bacterium]
MSSHYISTAGSWSTVNCQQCGQIVDDNARYCDACGAYLKLSLFQGLARIMRQATLGGTFGVITGAACALTACLLVVSVSHISLSLGALGRVAELAVVVGAGMGAIFDGVRQLCR